MRVAGIGLNSTPFIQGSTWVASPQTSMGLWA